MKKDLYAFWANTYGPFHKKPTKVSFDSELNLWWDKSGFSSVEREGLVEKEGFMCFSSKNKAEVALFIKGFNAARSILCSYFNVDCPTK